MNEIINEIEVKIPTYTITLADGTVVENLQLNGNNFISDTLIEDSVFDNNLSTVTFSYGEKEKTYHNMVLIQNMVYGGKSWFILAEKTAEQIREERIAELEAQNADLANQVMMQSAVMDELLVEILPSLMGE